MTIWVKLIGISCLIFFITSCKQESVQVTWDEDKTVEILADLRIIDDQLKKHRYYQKDSVTQLYKELLIEIHDISEEELEENIRIIQSNPGLAQKYEDAVLKLLRKRENSLE